MMFWNLVEADHLNKRQFAHLKGKAQESEKIVDKYGGINISGIYGSIEIDEKDFVVEYG
jgi:hypothetical protein